MSSEGSGRSSSRENQDAVHTTPFRSAAFLSHHDRSASDDGPAIKGVAGAKKSRFTALKSPRNLFARRRSSQNANKLDDSIVNVSDLRVPAMPDNIETSIRGNIVHDWSRPRNRGSNIDSSPRPDPPSTPSYPRRPSEASPYPAPSVGTPTSAHGPFFREHFQEEQRPVQPGNTAYLHGQNLQPPPSGALPKFAQRLPLDLPSENEIPSSPLPGSYANDTEPETTSTLPPEPDMAPPPPPPPSSPPTLPEEPPSPVLDLPPVDTLPKHMTSTSSRFSFQIGQQGSIAQEKFLEEKHKEHALRKPAATRLSVTSMDDMYDYGYDDDMDDEDGFHNDDIVPRNIDIPSSQHAQEVNPVVDDDYGQDYGGDDYGYGEDEEDDEFGTEDIPVRNIDVPTSRRENREAGGINSIKRQSLQAFHFTPQSLSFSPTTAENTSTSTPRDPEGYPIGMAESKEGVMYNIQPQIRDSFDQSPDATFYEGLGISTLADTMPGKAHLLPQTQPFDDSDIYFHDSEFDNDVADFDADFNEDMLDDAERIRDIPAENARKFEQSLQRSLPDDQIKVVSGGRKAEILPETPQRGSWHTGQPESSHQDMPTGNLEGLTEGNLAAYHDALAQAANQAAANGKFDRVDGFSRASDDETDSPFHNSIPALSSRGSKYSNHMMGSGISDEDGFGFDDDLDDEAMIAAANAEALENDDDGFYGQEFGFFARAHGKDSAEFSSGGYFASRGSNGVKRSHSAKNNFQEPSLTPITERSELSARNSMISLPVYPGLLGTGGTIAEMLDRDSPIVEDEMSMSTLAKLRSKTFGGSSTSVNSSGDRHHSLSSPLAHLSGYNPGLTDSFMGRMSSPTPGMSAISITESEDEEEEYSRSTLTQNTPHKKQVNLMSHPLYDQMVNSPLAGKGHHSRNSSGAESVSYAQDADGRWVLERTRKGDDGEIESVEREYLLAGARI